MSRDSEQARRYALNRFHESCERGAFKRTYLVPFVPDPDAAAEPITDEGKDLLALGEGDCRWPVGRDADGAMRFCGCPAHRPRLRYAPSYCSEHARRAVRIDDQEAWRVEEAALLEVVA